MIRLKQITIFFFLCLAAVSLIVLFIPAIKKNSPPTPLQCRDYGQLNLDIFLTKYTVQNGDTLLSVSRKEMGQSDRVNELIQLNKAKYPGLSITNSVIEPGWVLYIPQRYFPVSYGDIEGIAGKITRNDPDSITLNVRRDRVVESVRYKTSRSLYLNRKTFKVGDCVYVINDPYGPAGLNGILTVSSQDPGIFRTPGMITYPAQAAPDRTCFYGLLDRDFFLQSYTAQKGDTLMLIARKELGDSSRTAELININRVWYPHLSIKNPFIEVGWNLRLPPKIIGHSSGFLVGWGGRLRSLTDTNISVDMIGHPVGGFSGPWMNRLSPGVKFPGSGAPKVGDCVYLIEDTGTVSGPDYHDWVVAVSLQDKNYFK